MAANKGCMIAIGVAAGLFFLFIAGCGALVFFGARLMAGPENVEISLETPIQVIEGEKFEFKVTVENTGAVPVKLVDIDIYDSYLDGIAVESVEPLYKNSSHLFEIQTYEFGREIPGGEKVEIIFHALALRPGDYSGGVDISIGNVMSFVSRVARTIVLSKEEALEQAAPEAAAPATSPP